MWRDFFSTVSLTGLAACLTSLLIPRSSFLSQLDTLVCGTKDDAWTVEELRSAIKVDHGFTIESQPVLDLIEVMSSFEKKDRRLFCMFITGSPNLPVGGTYIWALIFDQGRRECDVSSCVTSRARPALHDAHVFFSRHLFLLRYQALPD